MHSDLRSRRNGVVGVRQEARIHSSIQGLARRVKWRLRDGVVLCKELKDDGVASRNAHLVGLEDETARTTNLDGMAGTCGRDGGSLALADCSCSSGDRDGSLLLAGAGGDGLGDCDLFVDIGPLGATAWVGPDDDDVAARVKRQAVALHAVEDGKGSSIELGLGVSGNWLGLIDAAGLASNGQRREGQRDGC